MDTFKIEIDATQLAYRNFIIPTVTDDWVDSRVVQSFSLAAGTYRFQVASGYMADFTFRIGNDGKIDYDDDYIGFLEGRGSSRLILKGLTVSIDARYLGMNGGQGVLLVVPSTNEDWIIQKTVRLLPASHYLVQQGSGLVSSFEFKLSLDGTFQYNPSYDVASGGFMKGNGLATLTFIGYPFLLDGTAPGVGGVHFTDVWGLTFAHNGVQFANLLPMRSPYRLQVTSGGVTQASVLVHLDGTTTLNSGGGYLLSRDSFKGVPRITITRT